MRAVPMSINLVGASCILTQGIMAENSSGVNDANGSGSASSSQTPASFSSTSSTMNNNNNNNNIHKNGSNNGSNGHSTYYYNNRQRINAEYDDEQTYLDLFGERAKELFTQHIIPSTDAECRWDWRMGRCEPYCVCGFQFLWGDYHLGRSCRYRPSPPPARVASGDGGVESSKEESEDTWQEAWQEVWHSQMTGGTVDDVTSFVPPLFPKGPPPDVTAEESTTTSTTCTLPPESRYIQVIHQLTTAFTHSTIAVDKFQLLKNATSNAVIATMVQSQHHWTIARQKACETVKKKVEERAQIRNQPVVLTKQGATWIRRVCGTGDGSVMRGGGGDEIIDRGDGVDEYADNAKETESEDIAEEGDSK